MISRASRSAAISNVPTFLVRGYSDGLPSHGIKLSLVFNRRRNNAQGGTVKLAALHLAEQSRVRSGAVENA